MSQLDDTIFIYKLTACSFISGKWSYILESSSREIEPILTSQNIVLGFVQNLK